jgi:hypothetical protein
MYTHASQHSDQRRAPGPILRRLLSWVISWSRHGKRVFFITSLYSHIVRIDSLRAEAISKLNEIMGLARRETALHLPMAYHEVVWHNTGIDKVLSEELLNKDISEEQALELSKRVVKLTPRWIKYGRENDMVNDVFDLIRNGSLLAAAA